MSKDGHRLCEKAHETGYTKCPLPGCKGGWSSKKAEKRHNKNFHSDEVQEHRCEFCPQHKPFRTVWDLKHIWKGAQLIHQNQKDSLLHVIYAKREITINPK